ncbi:NmrA family NAD(P)-binding protein [Nocardia blacklockiae]|uniref:NmrA family NAD(P)-binding protein n=1 Tax=Nocardia blacklockiae TaxID=480036 RepID=UPI0018945B45|nr:NmrA family NAD(P)-binding protein [Nocardia blacklockiae]MBF6173794.1 NmrA family NAD(P)-binding protein [Nocardia blacklockiae]
MSERNEPILVTGATGKQGGATVRHLLAAGRPVRALVRDTTTPAARALAAAGAELALGDFDEPGTLRAAVTSVRGVFAVPPNPFDPTNDDKDREARRGVALVEAARDAEVDHFVFTGIASFDGDGERVAAGKQAIEDAVRAGGMRYTLLRPVRFMENYLAQGTPIDGITGGVHRHLFPPDHPVQMIAVDDIGVLAARAFAEPERFHGRTLELAGDALTPVAAAARITAATGIPVRYHQLSEAEADALGEPIASVARRVADGGSGWHADLHALRVIHPGLRTFDDWLAETGAAQLKSLLDGAA